jgi:hypothetical protein
MRLVKIGMAAVLTAAAAACGQSGGNVMTSSNANSLTPEQVDLALGNEVSASAEVNGVTNEVDDQAQSNSSE